MQEGSAAHHRKCRDRGLAAAKELAASAHDPALVLFRTTLIRIEVAPDADRRRDCDRLVQRGVTIDARNGTSDPNSRCPTTKSKLSINWTPPEVFVRRI
jgi:hypothetical protein